MSALTPPEVTTMRLASTSAEGCDSRVYCASASRNSGRPQFCA